MAEPRRSYRAAQPPAEPIVREEPTPEPERKQVASGRSPAHNVTGFFTSKSGKAETVFVTEAICEALKNLQPGDTLGISKNDKTQRWGLFYFEGNQ